jgi:hypothetical protein
MKVPVVSTAALQGNVMPKKVVTPQISLFPSTSTLVTMPAPEAQRAGLFV